MALVKCLYCDADNDPRQTAYCEECGKRLPTSALIQPRTFARSGGGVEEAGTVAERQERGKAAEALLTATIIHLVAGGLFLVGGPALFKAVPESFMATVLNWTVGPAVVLGALAFAARARPGWPAVAAVVVYLVWVGVGFALDAPFATRWLPVSLVTLAFLAWACWTARRAGRK